MYSPILTHAKRLSIFILMLCWLATQSVAAQENPDYHVTDLAWSPDGSKLATAIYINGCHVDKPWTSPVMINDGSQYDALNLMSFDANNCSVMSVDWNPDGTQIVGTTLDGNAYVWDVQTGKVLITAQQKQPNKSFAKWSPNGNEILSGTSDNTFELWNPKTGVFIRRLKINGTTADWSPDGRQIVVGNQTNHQVYVYHVQSDKTVLTLSGHTAGITSVSWSPDGKKLGSTSEDGTAKIWDAASGKLLTTLVGHTGKVFSIDWNPVLEQVVTVGEDRTGRVWEIPTGKQIDLSHGVVNTAAWSPKGDLIAYGDIYNISGIAPAPIVYLQPPPETFISSVAWSPNGKQIAVGYATDTCEPAPNLYTIDVLDAVSHQVVQKLSGSNCDIMSMDWSPDGTKLAAASLDGFGLRAWDVGSGELVMTVQRGGQGMATVKWRPPNGLEIAVTSAYSNGVSILDAKTGEMSRPAHIGGFAVDWSPDGSKLAGGDTVDYQIYVADILLDQQVMILRGHTDFIGSLDWSPDGSTIASASADDTIRLWDAKTGKPLLVINTSVTDLRWSPNSQYLATINNNYDIGNGTVEIWDATKGALLSKFPYQSRIYAVDWSPNGKQLVYGGKGIDGKAPEIQIVDVRE